MLSSKAEQLINSYLNLPFKGLLGVRTPYYNNARGRERGQLRMLVGKGLPYEIVEEAQIISIQYHAGLFNKDGDCCLHEAHDGTSADLVRKFLIDNNLGIECSGFVTHVLNEHYKETKNISLTKKMHIVSKRHLARWLISKLRPVENINVRTYTDERNSRRIIGDGIGYNYDSLLPGDVVIMLETGLNNKRNHIMLITNVIKNKIEYVHARAWTSEGQCGHGVTCGTITITKPNGTLIEQDWVEKGLIGEKNETFLEAKQAKILEIRRLIF